MNFSSENFLVESLMNLTLRNIFINLQLNHKICKKNNFKIPTFISNLLFKYIHERKRLFNASDFRLFHNDISSLTVFRLDKKTYGLIKYLELLDKHFLYEIDCYNSTSTCEKIKQEAADCLFKNCSNLRRINIEKCFRISWIFHHLPKSFHSLQKISINLIDTVGKDLNLLENIFRNCLKLKKIKIIFDKNMNLDNSLNIIYSLLPSVNTLTSVNLIGIVGFFPINTLFSILEKFKKLRNITISLKLSNDNNGEVTEEFGDFSDLEDMKKLRLPNCNFPKIYMKTFEKSMKTFKNLREIDFSFNTFILENCQNFFNCFNISSKTLKEIFMIKCNLNYNISCDFGEFLYKCQFLEVLVLDENKCMGDGLSNICDGLSSCADRFKRFSLVSCNLDSKQCLFVGKFLEKCPNLECLQMDENEMIHDGFRLICNGLKASLSNLKHLNFSECFISSENYKYLKKIIKLTNLSLTYDGVFLIANQLYNI